ncbi:MAG TPA: hypothetical protein V6C58_00575 [Allocoleopsis sp.]
MSQEFYTVNLCSANGYDDGAGGSQPGSQLTYYFDWGQLPEQAYYIDYSLTVNQTSTYTPISSCFVTCLNTNFTLIQPNSTISNNIGCLGPVIMPNNIASSRVFKNNIINSPNVFIPSRPTSNNFKVIFSRVTNNTLSVGFSSYNLTLKFIPAHNIDSQYEQYGQTQ